MSSCDEKDRPRKKKAKGVAANAARLHSASSSISSSGTAAKATVQTATTHEERSQRLEREKKATKRPREVSRPDESDEGKRPHSADGVATAERQQHVEGLDDRYRLMDSSGAFIPQRMPTDVGQHPDPLFLDWYQSTQQSLFTPTLAQLLGQRQNLPFLPPISNLYAHAQSSHIHLNPYTLSGEGKADESSLVSLAAASNPFLADSTYASLPGVLQGRFPAAAGLPQFSDPMSGFAAHRAGMPPTLSSLYQPGGSALGSMSQGLGRSAGPLALNESGAMLLASLDQIRRGQSHSFDAQLPISDPLLSDVVSGRVMMGFPNTQGPHLLPAVDPTALSEDALASALVSHIRSRGGFGSTADIPWELPVPLSLPEDNDKLSPFQILLRNQIEVFKASNDDISTHTRGRNKPITLGQVGIRCRHCANLPVKRRQKGATYYPSTIMGIYQAAQNMSVTHLQEGSCKEMPNEVKFEFEQLLSTKATSTGAGRPYWAQAAQQLGLIDTDDGIRFIRDFPTFG